MATAIFGLGQYGLRACKDCRGTMGPERNAPKGSFRIIRRSAWGREAKFAALSQQTIENL